MLFFRHLCILLILLLIYIFPCSAQSDSVTNSSPSPDTHFSLLTVKDGLPYNTIMDIVADHQGFLWMATPEGICRYDGTSFITYKHNVHDSTTLMSNQVNSLAVDSKGILWGSTGDGLFHFDPAKGIFINYYPRKGDSSTVSCDNLGRIFIDKKDFLYAGSWTDFNVYNPATKSFRQYFHNEKDPSSIRDNKVGYTYEDRQGRIWIGTYSGLDLFDPQTNSFQHIRIPSLFEQFGEGPLINDMYADAQGNLWLSTWASGLIKYNHESGKAEIFRIEKDRPVNGSTNVVTSILHTDYQGEENKLWIGTKSSGLYLFDMLTNTFMPFKETTFGDPNFITSDINKMYDDGVGNIFIGTGEGLLHYSRSKKIFNTIALTFDQLKCLPEIFSIYQDPADATGNTLWIGTWTCGGFKYNRATGAMHQAPISFSADPLVEYSAIHNFYRDRKGNLWAFCRDGTYLQKKNSETWIRLPASDVDESKLWPSTIASFKENEDGTFWFGCRRGLMHYDPAKDIAKRYRLTSEGKPIEFKGSLEFVVYPKNIFWIVGASGMLIKYNATDQSTVVYKHNPNDTTSFPVSYDIREIFIDHQHVIWMGTKNGLIYFNPMDSRLVFNSFHTSDGLPSESVQRILEDSKGKLWCATQNGISRFDHATSSFRNYGISDGLSHPDLSGAFSLSAFGNIFIGLFNQLQYFNPVLTGNSSYCGPLRVTGIKVLGKDYVSAKTPSYTDSIRLSYKQNEVTISFSMINYADGNQTVYDYYLEGLNDEWIPIGTNHSVTFTNLDGGTYYLHVRGYNSDGVCGDGERILTLVVTPPFWKTNWFYIAITIFTIASVFIYIRLRLRHLHKAKRELEDTVAKRTEQLEIQKNRAEQSEKFKQQFLANMSHEIRTPMNAVVGMTNLLLDKHPRTDQDYYLQAVKRSSETLLHIINDILDLSKIEAGKVELEHIDFSLQDTIRDITQVLQTKADEKAIQLITETDDIPVLRGDPVRIYQVLMNLAGNAIKFTETGSVLICAKIMDNASPVTIQFSVTDTGIGIPGDKLKEIFENFTQAHTSDTRKYGGTGLGLSISRQLIELLGGRIEVVSEVGSGTTFSFILNFQPGSAEKLQNIDPDNEIDGSILDGLSILVADDNEYNRIVVTDTLKLKAKVTVYHASTGKEVISLLQKNKIDVILMDVQMPEMNGYDATRYIRNNFPPPSNEIPIIALTASVLRTDLDICRQAGMNAYIPKPFKTSHLLSTIAEALKIEIRTVRKKKIEVKEPLESNHGITNLNYLRKFCENDSDRVKNYVLIFLKSAPVMLEKIRAAVHDSNYLEIADQVHSYKTTWVMMGMNQTKELALKIENQCREQNGHDTLEKTQELLEHIEQAISELSYFK